MQNIFVVDTNLERRNFLYGILMQLNCKVTTLPTFKELLDALKKERPSVIVIEIESNDDAMKSVLKKMREIDQAAKIIALVADDIDQDVKDVIGSEGVVTYLKKDTKAADIVVKLLEVVNATEDGVVESKITFNKGILIIDDNEGEILLLKTYLDKRGYKVDVALNGEEGLFMIKANKPKVVILDIMMPGMDGALVLKRIKEISGSIEVIVVSGVSDKKTVDEIAKLGAMKYLCKPFGLEDLEEAVVMGMVKSTH